MEKSKIFIVEDELIIAKELETKLINAGYSVSGIATSGEEAVEGALKFKPDIILMDITLHGSMTGIEAAEIIGKSQTIPVIYISASSDETTIKKAEKSAPFGFIIKPYEDRELHNNIEIALLRHQIEKQFIGRGEWFTSVFDSMGDAVIATDRNSNILIMNPQSEKLTGWSKEEATGKKITEVFKTIDEKTGEDLTYSLLKNRNKALGDTLINTQILISRTGQKIYIDKNTELIKEENGAIRGVVLIFRDITEKRILQQRILDSEKKFRQIFDNTDDAVFLYDKGICVDYNVKAGRYFGRKDVYLTDIPLNLPQTSFEYIVSQIMLDKIGRGEFSIMTRAGSTIEADISRTSMEISNKLMDLIVIHDITEKNKLANSLRQSEKQYRQLVELAEEGIWSINNNFETTFANPRMAALTGFTVSQMNGRQFYSFFYPEDIKNFPKIGMKKLSRKNLSFEARLIRRDRSSIFVHMTGSPLLSEADPGFIFVVSDITDIKKEQDEIRKLSYAIEQSPSSIVITDTEGNIEYINSRFMELTAYSREELIGKNQRILKSGDTSPESYAKMWNTIKSGDTWRGFFHNRKKNGELYWEEASLSPIKNGDGVITHYIGLKEDITDKKAAEEKLQKTLSEFADLNKNLDKKVIEEVEKNREMDRVLIQQSRLAAMGEMIGNIAHQWRQPINALGIIIQNIGQAFDYNMLTKKYLDDTISRAMSVILYMSKTIDDFRNFFKQEKEKEAFSINDAVKKTISFVESSLKDHNIEIKFTPEKEIIRFGYPNEYCQAIMNLMSNVKDVIIERKIPESSVIITLKEENGKSVLTVQDEAGGIAENIIDKIFDPYFTTKEFGSGIGLYMSKVIIENNMGGKLTAFNIGKDQRKAGAVFRIEL